MLYISFNRTVRHRRPDRAYFRGIGGRRADQDTVSSPRAHFHSHGRREVYGADGRTAFWGPRLQVGCIQKGSADCFDHPVYRIQRNLLSAIHFGL